MSNYPLEPNEKLYKILGSTALWYCSPDKTFGCWIKNNAKKKFSLVGTPVRYKDKYTYTSVIPLHDHQASTSPFRDLVCWQVDEQGFGRYIILPPTLLYDE